MTNADLVTMPKAPKTKIKKTVKPVHPNSREAANLCWKAARDKRVSKNKGETSLKLDLLAEKLQWFQENLDYDKNTYTKKELATLTEKYLNRFQEELDQIDIVKSIGQRQGQQHISRKTAINMTTEKEKRDFEGPGFEVPDLVNGKHLEIFKKWNGELRYLQNIKLRKSFKTDLDNPEIADENCAESST